MRCDQCRSLVAESGDRVSDMMLSGDMKDGPAEMTWQQPPYTLSSVCVCVVLFLFSWQPAYYKCSESGKLVRHNSAIKCKKTPAMHNVSRLRSVRWPDIYRCMSVQS